MISDKEFAKILRGVPRAYDDFVNGLTQDITDQNVRRQVVEFVKENPGATAGYVIKFYSDNFWVDDDEEEE